VNRFDQETKDSFLDLYSKVDIKVAEANSAPIIPTTTDDEIPF
jgi:hypothetical protein